MVVMSAKLERTFTKLSSPWKIQEYISKIPYNPDDYCRSAERVVLEQKAHCLEGALLAAVALERLGHQPQLMHLRSHRDDDHVIALFREKKKWGAVGKSNTTLLTWRPALYDNLQALFMSYFPFYFNQKGEMSLYAWAGPIDLARYEKKWHWRNSKKDISDMGASFYNIRGERLLSLRAIEKLAPAPKLLRQACFLGANKSGLYKG